MATQQEILTLLANLSLTHWIAMAVVYLVSVILAAAVFMRWFWRKQFRLYRNLKRPIMIITPTDERNAQIAGKEMNIERNTLTQNRFLKIDDTVTDYRSFNPNNKHCIVVLGYDPEMAGLDDVLNKVKALQIPLIVYTFGENNAIGDEHKPKFATYPLTLYANFQLTLMNHIFSTLAVYPYDKK